MQGGVRHQGGQRLQQGHGNRRASAQHGLNLSQRRALLSVQPVGGRHHVHQGGGGGEHDRSVDGRRGRGQGRGRQGLRAGHIHGRGHAGRAQRRAQQGKRREAGHQAATGSKTVGVRDGIAHTRQLPLRVHHALGRAGRTGGVQHRRVSIRNGGGELHHGRGGDRLAESSLGGGSEHGTGNAQQLLLRGAQRFHRDALARPEQGAGGGQRGGNTDQEARVGALQRAGQARQAQAGVGHDDDRAELQAGVDQGGQACTGRHHEVHAVARAYAQGVKAGRGGVDLAVQPGPGEGHAHCGAIALGVHIDHGHGGVVGAFGEGREHGAECLGNSALSNGTLAGGSRRGFGVQAVAARAGGAVLGLSVARRNQGTVLAAGSEGLCEPGHDRRGDIVILGHQVRGILVAVHLSLRHALHQVEEVAALEHRILRAPLEERGHVQVANLLGDALHGRVRGHVGAGRNIAHEVAHALAPGRVGVGGAVGAVNRLVQRARVQALGLLTLRLRQGAARGAGAGGSGLGQTTLVLGQAQGHINKRGGITGAQLVHAQSQAQGGGDILNAVVVHRGVRQQHA